MALRTVLTWPNEKLRNTAQPVTEFDAALQTLVTDMFDTMYDAQGVGLAAIQIGVPQSVIVMDCGADGQEPITLINAKITDRMGSLIWREGCLSFPGVSAEINRAETVTIEYQNVHGDWHTLEASGLLAVCIQHELDHLDGQLYFDRMGELERKSALLEYRKIQEDDVMERVNA